MKLKILALSIIAVFLFPGCKNFKKKSSEEIQINKIATVISSLDRGITENSGLIFWDQNFWTFNDSGGKNELYAVDTGDGKIVRTLKIVNATNIDWEDIAQDELFIYIADIGNNLGERTDLCIYKIDKSSITYGEQQEIIAEKISYRYDDQKELGGGYKNHSFDAEAIIVQDSSIILFTKDWAGFKTAAYRIPIEPGDYIVSPFASADVNCLITGADINDEGEISFIGYFDYVSFIFTFKPDSGSYFAGLKKTELSELGNVQTEGICYKNEDELFISSEKTLTSDHKIWKIKN